MMAALAKAISRATRTNVDVETLKVLVIFSGAGLLLSLVAAMIYGQVINAAMFRRARVNHASPRNIASS